MKWSQNCSLKENWLLLHLKDELLQKCPFLIKHDILILVTKFGLKKYTRKESTRAWIQTEWSSIKIFVTVDSTFRCVLFDARLHLEKKNRILQELQLIGSIKNLQCNTNLWAFLSIFITEISVSSCNWIATIFIFTNQRHRQNSDVSKHNYVEWKQAI